MISVCDCAVCESVDWVFVNLLITIFLSEVCEGVASTLEYIWNLDRFHMMFTSVWNFITGMSACDVNKAWQIQKSHRFIKSHRFLFSHASLVLFSHASLACRPLPFQGTIVHVCMYVSTQICLYTHIHTRTHIHIRTHRHTHTNINTNTNTYTLPKWQKNDLVSGGHGRAAKLGACVNWVDWLCTSADKRMWSGRRAVVMVRWAAAGCGCSALIRRFSWTGDWGAGHEGYPPLDCNGQGEGQSFLASSWASRAVAAAPSFQTMCARLWVYICTLVGAFCLFVLSNLSTTCACITGIS